MPDEGVVLTLVPFRPVKRDSPLTERFSTEQEAVKTAQLIANRTGDWVALCDESGRPVTYVFPTTTRR